MQCTDKPVLLLRPEDLLFVPALIYYKSFKHHDRRFCRSTVAHDVYLKSRRAGFIYAVRVWCVS